MWRALIYRVIEKQHAKREQIYPVCLHTVEKHEKVESINTQNDYKTTSKKLTDKKKTNMFLSFVIMFKFQYNKLKIVQKKF